MRRRRIPQVVQLAQTECGLASALMIMKFHGSGEALDSLRKECDPGRDGLSVRQLRNLFESRGFRSKMYRAGLPGLARVQLPAVIFWENYHFVVLERVTARHAVIVDPAAGRRRVPLPEFEECYSGVVIQATPGTDFTPCKNEEKSPWPEFLAPLKRATGRLTMIALLSLLLFGASLVVPFVTKAIVDEHGSGHSWSLTSQVSIGLAAFVASYLALSAVRVLVMTSVSVHMGRATMHKVFRHLLFLPYKYFSSRAPGELLFRLNSVNHVRDLVAAQLSQAAVDLILAAGLIGVMLMLSPTLALTALLCVMVTLVVLVSTRGAVSEALDSELSQSSKSQSMQLEAVVAVTAVKLSGSEGRLFRDWSKTYERALAAIRRHSNLQGLINCGISVTQLAAPLLILAIGVAEVVAGNTTLGTVIAFQAVAGTFFGIATSLFASFTMVIQARQYLNRLTDITHADQETDEGTDTTSITGRIELQDVSFRYSKHSPEALNDITMEVSPGERIAIVGRSGSGKSTLGRVLCGLIDPTDGRISYEGLPKAAFSRDHFYQHMGYVPQEVHLLNRTILENITMNNPELGEDDARLAAAEAMVAADIQALPMGYQTLVSEMGGNFSGGQRQRIALARALVRHPRVLILDEATSSLDTFNESRITAMLRDKRCTVIVIAHRMSTVVGADRIYVMDAGRIVEVGSHEELMLHGQRYRDLFASSFSATGETLLGSTALAKS